MIPASPFGVESQLLCFRTSPQLMCVGKRQMTPDPHEGEPDGVLVSWLQTDYCGHLGSESEDRSTADLLLSFSCSHIHINNNKSKTNKSMQQV